jgi:AraC-like DNA-binding protein
MPDMARRTRKPALDAVEWLKRLERPDCTIEFHSHYFGYQDMPRGWRTDGRLIDDHLVSLVVKGRGRFGAGGHSTALLPGVLLWVAPEVEHALRLDPGLARRTVRFKVRDRAGGSLRMLPDFLALSGAWGASVYLEQIEAELLRRGDHSERRLKHLVALLSIHAFRLQAGAGAPERGLSEQQHQLIVGYVSARIDQRIRPAELARLVGLSPEYFTRVFRASYGVAPRRWLMQERIRCAARTLLDTGSDVTSVAHSFGYDDIYLFSRQFKLVMGQSPRNFARARAPLPPAASPRRGASA